MADTSQGLLATFPPHSQRQKGRKHANPQPGFRAPRPTRGLVGNVVFRCPASLGAIVERSLPHCVCSKRVFSQSWAILGSCSAFGLRLGHGGWSRVPRTSAGRSDGAGWAGRARRERGGKDRGWATASGRLEGLGGGRVVRAEDVGEGGRRLLASTPSFCDEGRLGGEGIGKCGKCRIARAGSAESLRLEVLVGAHIPDEPRSRSVTDTRLPGCCQCFRDAGSKWRSGPLQYRPSTVRVDSLKVTRFQGRRVLRGRSTYWMLISLSLG